MSSANGLWRWLLIVQHPNGLQRCTNEFMAELNCDPKMLQRESASQLLVIVVIDRHLTFDRRYYKYKYLLKGSYILLQTQDYAFIRTRGKYVEDSKHY